MVEASKLGSSLVKCSDSSGCMFMELDTQFNVVVADPTFQRRFGVRPGATRYRSLVGAEHICSGCPALPVFQGKEKSGGRIAVSDDGRLVYLKLNIVPLTHPSREVRGCAILVTETGQLRPPAESWACAELRFEKLLHQLPDVVFSLDSAGRFVLVNQRASEFLGFPLPKILGRHLWEFVPPHDAAKARRIRCRPVYDSDGRLVEYEGVMRDRTARRKLEEDLWSSKEELLEKTSIIDEPYEHIVQSEESKAIMEHTAEVAHELRQPLAIIGGFARRMHKQLQDCKAIELATQMDCFTVREPFSPRGSPYPPRNRGSAAILLSPRPLAPPHSPS